MISPAPVSLCLIVKNESRLRESLEPVRPFVKEIVVVDTGSSGEEVERLTDLQHDRLIDILYVGAPGEFDFHGVPIDFSKARQKSFALATQPWAMWMDGDDTIEGIERLPQIIAELEAYVVPHNPRPVWVFFPYEYNYDAQGRCDWLVMRERLLPNPKQWVWNDFVHEYVALPDNSQIRFDRHDMVWKHGRQRVGKKIGDSTTRNWNLYKKYLEIKPPEEEIPYRTALYLGICMTEMGLDRNEAAKFLVQAVNASTLDEHLLDACRHLVTLLIAMGDFRRARVYAMMMIDAKENWPDGYFALSKVYFHITATSDYKDIRAGERCLHFGRLGLAIPDVKWFSSPTDRLTTMTQMVQVLDHFSRYREALELSEEALKLYPGDTHASFNRDLFGVVVGTEMVRQTLAGLRTMRGRGVNPPALALLARDLPGLLAPEVLAAPKTEVGPASLLPSGVLRILFACGDNWEVWNPDVLKGKGFGGGSEAAVVELSQQLQNIGHTVTVSTTCGEPKDYDGVRWRPAGEIVELAHGPYDVFIAWRVASFLDSPAAEAATLRVLWLHDVIAHQASESNLAKADVVVVSTEFHKQCVLRNHPSLDARKIVILRWGADPKRFRDHTKPRNAHKAVTTYSPDRGLKYLIASWRAIRAEVPDAELHIFYGFDMWLKMSPNNQEALGLLEQIKSLEGEGVFYRQRVPPDALAKELLEAGVWAYPCTWPEIFCVAAVEAQMAGLRVVATNAGALPEVVLNGAIVDLSISTALERAVVLAMTESDGEHWPDRKTIGMAAMNAFSLAPIGSMWQNLLRKALLEKVDLPAFEGIL